MGMEPVQTLLYSSKNEPDRQDRIDALLRQKQCHSCPLSKLKTPSHDVYPESATVVVFSDHVPRGWAPLHVGEGTTGFPTYHRLSIECGDQETQLKNAASRQCCLGRKLKAIDRLKPKVVITIGASLFAQMEGLFGHDAPGFQDGILFPTKYNGHTFWHISVKDFQPKIDIMALRPLIQWAVENEPVVHVPTYKGIQCILDAKSADKAAQVLIESPYIGWDFETTELRPYSHGKILTIAFSNGDQSFAFPVYHPQTPKNFDPMTGFYILRKLFGQNLIAHNLPFELEWLAKFLGPDILYEANWQDTMAQAYLLAHGPKSLNALIRKFFGFNLKKMSNLDSANLARAPLNQVLTYNALDAQWTQRLFMAQERLIIQNNLTTQYEAQIELARGAVKMQNRGMCPNLEFIESESEKKLEKLNSLRKQFSAFDSVKNIAQAHGKNLNPISGDDVKLLFHSLGLELPGADEAILSSIDRPEAKLILEIRGVSKQWGTYLVPFNRKAKHKNAGKFLWIDDLIHPIFNTMHTITGRLSSEDPNAQNLPSGTQKYMRNVVKAFTDQWIFSADYGQIEYRFIAAMSEDPVMIDAILNGRDIHAFWATRIDDMFPLVFLKKRGYPCTKDVEKSIPCEPMCDKCEFKDFRGRCKNSIVFPLCFGSSPTSIAQSMGISEYEMKKIAAVFWDEHKVVKQWQNKLRKRLDKNGFVENGFGRRYYAPLDHTKMINYPIQGSNGDLVNRKMSKLARMAHERKEPWLCPVVNEHDNLWGSFPVEKFQECTEIWLQVMLDKTEIPWFPVPLLVEAETGPAWGSLKSIGEFSSTLFEK